MDKDRFIEANGLSIRYRESGAGDPLLLVHGIAGFLEEWEPAIEKLSNHFRVIALDLPGHGLSDKPEIPYTLDCLTGFLKDFITAKKLSKIYLAGHSLGGAVCFNFVLKYPSVVKKLILINSAFTKIPFFFRVFSFGFLQKINFTVPFSLVKTSSRRTFYNKDAVTEDWLNRAYNYINNPGALRTMFSVVHECMSFSGLKKDLVNTFSHRLSQIEIPALILYGDKDRILSNENSLLLHKLIKNSKIYPVKDCGHELQYEQCDTFYSVTIQFLEN